MKEIEVRDVLTLSDGIKYAVISRTTIGDKVYYYLVDINNYNNFKMCLEDRSEDSISLIEVEDAKEIEKLRLLFTKDIMLSLKELNKKED